MMAIDLSSVIYRQMNHYFPRIMTGDESWFLYLYLSDHMFAASRDEVIPREKLGWGPERYIDDFLQRCESDHLECTAIWCAIQSRKFHQ
jgi:hypothetical protein